MFNPDIQYRCTIIRGKAQKELDNLLPAYASIISNICPCNKEEFNNQFNEMLSQLIYKKGYSNLNQDNQKTIRNHITEIAGKLFGLFFEKEGIIHESLSNVKLLNDNDQPAFFKNLCFNFQFPNGTQKINTIRDRIENNISFRPFHFILALLKLAEENNVYLTKDEIGYYVLNAKEVLQGKVKPKIVLQAIISDRINNISKRLKPTSKDTQHIREQLNLLSLANFIFISDKKVYLNKQEIDLIGFFINELDKPLGFNIFQYDLTDDNQVKLMYSDWSEYFGNVLIKNIDLLKTNLKSQSLSTSIENKSLLGDQGEEYVFNLEKDRVAKTHPRLVNKIQLLGKIRGLGYDILSVEANENLEDPEFARFIEVKSTIRVTEPSMNDLTWIDTINLTRKEWVAAKQYRDAYNIYRVYFTANKVIVRKINDPFGKNENNIINVIPTMYRMDFNSESIDLEY